MPVPMRALNQGNTGNIMEAMFTYVQEAFLLSFCLQNMALSAKPEHCNSTLLPSESESLSVMSDSLWPQRLYSPWNSPGQNPEVGSLSFLQGIFPTQGLNPGLLHFWQILYQLSHQGRPRILEWVAYPFSRGSSWPRNRTGVSCNSGRFCTNWATREAPVPAIPKRPITEVSGAKNNTLDNMCQVLSREQQRKNIL